MKTGDIIKLHIENNEHYEFVKKKFKMDPYKIKGKIISSPLTRAGNYYLIELDVEVFGDKIIAFYESEIELDIQKKRNDILEKILYER